LWGLGQFLSCRQMKKFFLSIIFCLACLWVAAQAPGKIAITENDYQNREVTMADQFRADGKIYVVVAVIATVLAGIVLYLVVLDRKLTKLERMTKKQSDQA
jgi:CcmD family protein